MAQDTTQQRIIDYYRKQREAAELGAEEGKSGSVAQLSKIQGKLSRGTPAQRNRAQSEHGILSEQGAKPVSADQDPVGLLGGGLAGGVAGALSGIGRALFPRVAEAVGQRFIPQQISQKAAPIARQAAEQAAQYPRNLATGIEHSLTGEQRLALPGQKALAGRAELPGRTALRGSSPTQKALSPGKQLGKDFKQPAGGKAGAPRVSQTSQRAKGVNPRQQPGYVRGAKAKTADPAPAKAPAKVAKTAKPAQKPLKGTETYAELPAKTKKNLALQAAEIERSGTRGKTTVLPAEPGEVPALKGAIDNNMGATHNKADVNFAHKILKEAHGSGVSWTHARELLAEAIDRFRYGGLK